MCPHNATWLAGTSPQLGPELVFVQQKDTHIVEREAFTNQISHPLQHFVQVQHRSGYGAHLSGGLQITHMPLQLAGALDDTVFERRTNGLQLAVGLYLGALIFSSTLICISDAAPGEA